MMSISLRVSFCIIFTGILCVVDTFDQDFFWRDYIPNQIPKDAFEAASGRYIGQLVYQQSLLVATIYPYTNTAVAELHGQKNSKQNIKIFCTPQPHRFYWELVNVSKPNKEQMKDIIKGGYEEGLSTDLYIGKAMQDGEWKIGKVVEITHPSKGLWITDQSGKAVGIQEFFLLKYNSSGIELNLVAV